MDDPKLVLDRILPGKGTRTKGGEIVIARIIYCGFCRSQLHEMRRIFPLENNMGNKLYLDPNHVLVCEGCGTLYFDLQVTVNVYGKGEQVSKLVPIGWDKAEFISNYPPPYANRRARPYRKDATVLPTMLPVFAHEEYGPPITEEAPLVVEGFEFDDKIKTLLVKFKDKESRYPAQCFKNPDQAKEDEEEPF